MTPQSRSLLFLSLLASGGAITLSLMAGRYARILQQQAESAELEPTAFDAGDALRQVDRFIAVRRAVRQAADIEGSRLSPEQLMREARERALSATGLDPKHYAAIRRLYRQWKNGRHDPTHPVLAALELRRVSLRRVDLGSHERFDG